MRPILLAILMLVASHTYASTASANHGHHGGLGNGAIGGQSSVGSPAASAAAAGGKGGRYSLVDDYQPWPQAEMKQFQKPEFASFAGK
ncbi:MULTISPECIES: hypothetical protein [Paraburkholderia]|uniref:hypothetical protein n=1 Tax=Paraburkholderia TaxID=1822464 RepID=UPI002255D3AC|nr:MULTISPECIES: hypothetical protein [Paraburkholderia]MCX4154964.1 hypothetical protein [Paraburkholderia aspalathi]MDN7164375.1 hypothetical protein [Paraburkholderia sp. SECH2]MDQ6392860.1 hypothetical protein [Paraburkholderia aspalathi]